MISPAISLWPSARQFAEAVQCPQVCFSDARLRGAAPAFDRLGMPLVTSGQFAYVFKLKSQESQRSFAVRCFRGFLGDRDERYRAIDAHLRAHRLPALAGFEYDDEGIFVNGGRFPILVMEWIDGPTLDVYVAEVLDRPQVLRHLADEWVRLMRALRERRMAHGDLQHGNVIVESGRLRLVDLDNMYVPAMDGWESSEIGHQHYQHPARDEKLFGEKMDNFSALSIYLSLIALAERPALWAEHHDENLLFTKADFQNPAASLLLAKVKEIGDEHRQLAEALERAACAPPDEAPDLLTYVAPKSNLPHWMSADATGPEAVMPADLVVVNRTREASRIEVQAVEARSRAAAVGGMSGGATASARSPITPQSPQVQSVFNSAPAAGAVPAPFSAPLDLDQLLPASWYHARQFGKTWVPFIWIWLIAGRHIYEVFGISSAFSVLLTAITFPALCYAAGAGRAAYFGRHAIRAAIGGGAAAPSLSLSSPPPRTLGHNAARQTSPLASGAAKQQQQIQGPIIASRTQNIYHRPTCDWAAKISPGNRVRFDSPVAAQRASYRPCKICLP